MPELCAHTTSEGRKFALVVRQDGRCSFEVLRGRVQTCQADGLFGFFQVQGRTD